MPSLLDIANISTKKYIMNKVYTDEVGRKDILRYIGVGRFRILGGGGGGGGGARF